MGQYFSELKRSMEYLAQDERVVFLGQAVVDKGTGMTNTLQDVPLSQRIELPVAEEMQMGMSIGMALAGKIPVSIYPRWNFLLLATNQIVNHLDKLKQMSAGGYQPKVIVRVGIGSERPLSPQCQHLGDFSEAFRSMCDNIVFSRLDEPNDIFSAYQAALGRTESTIMAEWGDFYNEK